jgi:fibro-slime domain-containing protein
MSTSRLPWLFGLALIMPPLAAACGASQPGPSGSGGSGAEPMGTGGTTPAGSGGIILASGGGLIITDEPNTGGTGGAPPTMIIRELPAGFTAAEGALSGTDADDLRGGFQLIGALADVPSTETTACANVLRVLVRDFITFTHPDFGGLKMPADATGMVDVALGTDRKPVRAVDVYPDVAVQFADWYTNVEGTNVPYVVDLWLEPDAQQFVFDSSRFFPLDGVTSDEERQEDMDGTLRNFGFTTELHTAFEYQGGETFTFRGDDDVFVFVNGALVVDLGGVHGPVQGVVAIDDLGLTVGQVYNFDLFQAERNPVGSNFRVETSLDFTECGVILPDDIVK